jgi:hypothetical protein
LMPMQMHTMKLEQHQMASESHRMSQETQSFRLEESRRRAKDEAEAHQMIPDFVDAQLGLANDPSKDPFEKAQGIAALYSQLPSFALTNPAVSAVFGAANSITQSQFNSEKYQQDQFERRQKLQLDQDNKREAERTKVMEAYATSGNVKALEEMLSSGPSSLMGEAYLSLAQSEEGRARLAQAKNTAEQRDAEEKARFDMNLKNLNRLDAITFDPDGFGEGDQESDHQTVNTILEQYGLEGMSSPHEAKRAALRAISEAMGGTSAVIESSASKISGSMGL